MSLVDYRRRNPSHCRSRLRRSLAQAVAVCFGIMLIFGVDVAIADDPFPTLSCLESNVAFWQKIYSEYSSNQGVLHDSRRLDIIYDVIDLADQFGPGGRKINRARVKAARDKYKSILAALARGEMPVTPEAQKVAALFGAEVRATDFRQAMYRIRCQVGQKDRFREGLIRSGAYIEEIKAIFREHGLPEDLAYLPHVESSYNPKAYSKFGAAGIWQFTRSTGRRYMAVGYAVDERRDPIYSSHAAACLLKDNHDKLNDWPLAITAYNHGLTGMKRALRRKGSYEAIFQEYRSRIFRFASRNFYSEFLAAREVAKNCHQYFGDLILDPPQDSREVALAGYADLRDIADYLQVDLDHLRNLNPALRDPVFHGQKYVPKGYRLRLPVAADSSVAVELPDRVYAQQQKASRFYRVRSGDTAAKIARMHRVKLRDLIAANSLDGSAAVYVNQNLRIPALGETAPVLASADLRAKPQVTNSPLLSGSDSEKNLTPDSAEAESPAEDPRTDGVEDAIQSMSSAEPALSTDPADTVSEQPSDISPEDADSDSEELEADVAGEKELDETSAAESTAKGLPVPEVVVGNLLVNKVYRRNDRTIGIIQVEVEETLGHYAEWLDVPTAEIRRLNGFPFGRTLRISERIKVPLHKVSKEQFEQRRYEYHKELAEDFLGAYRVEEVRIYRVKKGDNIWTLARQQFEVPLWLIRQFNADVNFGALIPSQELRVPVVAKNA
jgi:membrane-bound lytic murein transglycosylase D